jgi:hypothetical protein
MLEIIVDMLRYSTNFVNCPGKEYPRRQEKGDFEPNF